jgi:hypothetical protein
VPDDHEAWLAEDATDRRVALSAATELASTAHHRVPWTRDESFTGDWLALADRAYAWLRNRGSLRPARLVLTAGTPTHQPEEPVALELDMTDVQADDFQVSALDSKGFPVPDGPYTWAEDSAGAVITIVPSADGSSVTATAVAPGQATLTVTDPTGLTGSELVVVTPGPVASIGITAGTPTP